MTTPRWPGWSKSRVIVSGLVIAILVGHLRLRWAVLLFFQVSCQLLDHCLRELNRQRIPGRDRVSASNDEGAGDNLAPQRRHLLSRFLWSGEGHAQHPSRARSPNNPKCAVAGLGNDLGTPWAFLSGRLQPVSCHAFNERRHRVIPEFASGGGGQGVRRDPAIGGEHVEQLRAIIVHFHLHLSLVGHRNHHGPQVEPALGEIAEIIITVVQRVPVEGAKILTLHGLLIFHWTGRSAVSRVWELLLGRALRCAWFYTAGFVLLLRKGPHFLTTVLPHSRVGDSRAPPLGFKTW